MIKTLTSIDIVGSARSTHPVLRYGFIAILAISLLQLLIPVRLLGGSTPSPSSGDAPGRDTPPGLRKAVAHTPISSIITRKGLFRPATPVADKPMADKTIERIKSQLKLQCVMNMNNEPVAYINITGVGLRKCKVGESIQDLFTVTVINTNSVDVTILGHKVTLGL